MGKFSFPYQICISVLSLLTVLSHPPHRLSLGFGTAANAFRWGLVLTHRLALGSGTDVKSLATFSSGPDPSERPRRKCPAAKEC